MSSRKAKNNKKMKRAKLRKEKKLTEKMVPKTQQSKVTTKKSYDNTLKEPTNKPSKGEMLMDFMRQYLYGDENEKPNNLAKIAKLLHDGVRPDYQDKKGTTIAMEVIKKGDENSFLLDFIAGFNPDFSLADINGKTAFMLDIEQGGKNFDYFLGKGYGSLAESNGKQNAFYVLYKTDIDKFNRVLNKVIKKNDFETIKSLFDYLYEFDKKSQLPEIKDETLLKRIASLDITLNGKTFFGKTMLMFACINRDYNLIEYFAKHTNDINAQDDNGNTALHYAMMESDGTLNGISSNAFCEILLHFGADRTIKNKDNICFNDSTKICHTMI